MNKLKRWWKNSYTKSFIKKLLGTFVIMILLSIINDTLGFEYMLIIATGTIIFNQFCIEQKLDDKKNCSHK